MYMGYQTVKLAAQSLPRSELRQTNLQDPLSEQ